MKVRTTMSVVLMAALVSGATSSWAQSVPEPASPETDDLRPLPIPPVAMPVEAPVPASPVPVVPIAAVADTPAAAARETPAQVVAVLDLRGGEQTASVARALTVVVAAEIGATQGYRAISRNDLRAMLEHQANAQLLGCTEVQCMADIAKLAAADLLVTGSVDRLDNAHVFALELIDPSVPKVIERQTVTWRDDPDRMVELARPYIDRLLSGARAQHFEGRLNIVAPTGARVRVDDSDVGLAPLPGPVQPLATGVHSVEVTQEGYVPFRHQAVVVRGEATLVRAELIDEDSQRPWYARWWVWGSVGGGLALAGGAAAAVVAYAVLSEPKPTTLDVVTQVPVAP